MMLNNNDLSSFYKILKNYHHSENAVESYLNYCAKYFRNYLVRELEDRFLYNVITFEKKDELKISPIYFGKGVDKNEKKLAIKYSNNLKALRGDQLVFNLSKHILKNLKKSVLLYKTPIHSFNNDIIAINLNPFLKILQSNPPLNKELSNIKPLFPTNLFSNNLLIKYLKKIALQLRISEKLIKDLEIFLIFYSYLSNTPEKNYYHYFIYPKTVHGEYNGLLLLTVTNPLKEQEIATIQLLLFYLFSETLIKKLVEAEQIRKETSLRAAIAAIMSRNISHWGSHVLTTVATEKTLDTIKLNKNQTLYRFLQNRMDYIAQISTEMPKWSYPAWFIKQIITDFFSQEHLLSYITVSEAIKRKNLRFIIYYNNNLVIDESSKRNILNIYRDCIVAIPGGVIGNHAFYIIIENIIRNSAKHGFSHPDKASKCLEITIYVKANPNSEFVNFIIYDNISKITSGYKKDLPNNLKLRKRSIPLHHQMNSKIIRGLLDENGNLRKEDWGLAEMKIAAGYLQNKSIAEIGGKGERNLDIIKAIAMKDDKGYHLGYTFQIPKPKEVLLVGFNGLNNDKLKKQSIFISENIPSNRNYEFILLNENVNSDFIKLLIKADSPYSLSLNDNLKIKKIIETFPNRVFLVSDKIKFFKSKFLNKRIILLSNLEYISLKKLLKSTRNQIELFKIRLYSKWLKHLLSFQSIENLTLAVLTEALDSSGYSNNRIEDEIDKQLYNLTINNKDLIKNIVLELIGLKDYQPNNNSGNPLMDTNGVISLPPDLDFIKLEVPNKPEEFIATTNKIAYIRHKALDSMGDNVYFENLSGLAQHFPILQSGSLLDYYQKIKLICQLIENGVIRIGIADERVCNSSIFQSELAENKFKFYLESAKIFIIEKISVEKDRQWQNKKNNHECELTLKGKLKIKKTNIVRTYFKYVDVDILIIHQGILDKLKLSQDEIRKWIDKVKEQIPFIVITSGRGRPENIPINAKYLPFSVIESFVISKPHHKFLLSSTLMNIVEEDQ